MIGALLLAWLLSSAVGADELASKARHFHDAIHAHHLSPEGLLLYRVPLDTIAHDFQSGSYPPLADTPTFTGIFAATACTRAALEAGDTKREALADAERALRGLRLLMDVTGEQGLLARGVRRDGVDPDQLGRRWLRGSRGFESYTWRGDVSLDQYANGLLPAVALCRLAFPELTRALVTDAAAHLLEHDMRLVDPDGTRTRFGDLSPWSTLGLNSIAMLTGYAVFALAAELDTDPRWAEQRDRLRDRYRVVARASITNVRILGITNYSNDLMAWNLYRVLVPLARRTRDPALADLRYGMFRAWLRVREDRNPYFTLVLCRLEPESCEADSLAAALEVLHHFPEDKRIGPLPAGLAELPRRWLPGRKLRPQARHLVPIELRPASSFEWKSSPYRLDGSVIPGWTYSGLDFLAAYWLYRDLAAPPPVQPG